MFEENSKSRVKDVCLADASYDPVPLPPHGHSCQAYRKVMGHSAASRGRRCNGSREHAALGPPPQPAVALHHPAAADEKQKQRSGS